MTWIENTALSKFGGIAVSSQIEISKIRP